jgi:PTS system fructose-specific IIA component/PTS system nitrogen regulatory IIA component
MKLSQIVVRKAILPELASAKRNDAIKELVDALVAAGTIGRELRDPFAKAVIQREDRGSTGFGHGVAVPHVKHAAIKKLAVAIGISRVGIDFNSLDRQPVHSIFLLLSPEDRPEDHLNAMEALFGQLGQDRFRRFLRQAKGVDDVVTLLEEADAGAPAR